MNTNIIWYFFMLMLLFLFFFLILFSMPPGLRSFVFAGTPRRRWGWWCCWRTFFPSTTFHVFTGWSWSIGWGWPFLAAFCTWSRWRRRHLYFCCIWIALFLIWMGVLNAAALFSLHIVLRNNRPSSSFWRWSGFWFDFLFFSISLKTINFVANSASSAYRQKVECFH